jgi:hypothetical protein
LNSDDYLLPQGLHKLMDVLHKNPNIPAAYGCAWNMVQDNKKRSPVWVEPFNLDRLALRCLISQPATLIRRSAWESAGGLDETLDMAMDYDLWWNRDHKHSKTNKFHKKHYQEATEIVRRHTGHVSQLWLLKFLFKSILRSVLR